MQKFHYEFTVKQTAVITQNEVLAYDICAAARRKEEETELPRETARVSYRVDTDKAEDSKLEEKKQPENVFELMNLDKSKALQVENEWKKGSPCTLD